MRWSGPTSNAEDPPGSETRGSRALNARDHRKVRSTFQPVSGSIALNCPRIGRASSAAEAVNVQPCGPQAFNKRSQEAFRGFDPQNPDPVLVRTAGWSSSGRKGSCESVGDPEFPQGTHHISRKEGQTHRARGGSTAQVHRRPPSQPLCDGTQWGFRSSRPPIWIPTAH